MSSLNMASQNTTCPTKADPKKASPYESLPTKTTVDTGTLTLRPVQPEDLPDVVELYNWDSANRASLPDSEPQIWKEAMFKAYTNIASKLHHMVVAIARTDNKDEVAGLGAIGTAIPLHRWEADTERTALKVIVHPKWSGKGIDALLQNEVHSDGWLRRVPWKLEILTYVSAEDTVAREGLEQRGYRLRGERIGGTVVYTLKLVNEAAS